VIRALKGNGISASDFASMANFADKIFHTLATANVASVHDSFDVSSWIVGRGASNHMTPYLHLSTTKRHLSSPVWVGLPDGTLKSITLVGDVHIHPDLTLQEVFYVPGFLYNLLSQPGIHRMEETKKWKMENIEGFKKGAL